MTNVSPFPGHPIHRKAWSIARALCLLSILWCPVLAHAQTASPRTSPTLRAPASPTMREICTAAAKASGAASARGTWRLTGSSRFHGADQTFEMIFDAGVRFRIAKSGNLGETDAFDGTTCWTRGPGGQSHPIVLQDCDIDRLVTWSITGFWTAKNAPLLRKLSTASQGELNVTLKPRNGVLTGTLVLDATTFLPRSLRYWTDSGDEVWTFSDYKPLGERLLPTRILHRSGEQEDKIEIAAAEKIKADAQYYRRTPSDTTDVDFDTAASNSVDIKRIAGYMFVHPRVDGQDAGWFFLDTGADNSCIDPTIAKKLHMTVLGSDTTAGVVGVTHLNICQAATLQLGPVTLKKPVFLEFDLAAIAQAFKLPITGICGYDLLSQVALDIDPSRSTMKVLQPGAATLPNGARWTKIGFNGNTPVITCRFADKNRGVFSVDTGSGSTVDFFTPAVEKFHLLANQDGTKSQTGGAGGVAESRQGPIPWFELGGIKILKPTVGFQLTKVGVFASPYRIGNIGMGFLRHYRLVLDFENERMAFVPQKDKTVAKPKQPATEKE